LTTGEKERKSAKDLHFIGIIPPKGHVEIYQEIKDDLSKRFDTVGAQNSPPHITLIPPFAISSENSKSLEKEISKAALKISPFKLRVVEFGRFQSRVLFADSFFSPELNEFQKELLSTLSTAFTNSINKSNRQFKPHITLAFKDLRGQAFLDAWNYLRTKKFQEEFLVEDVRILKLQRGAWTSIKSIPLGS
jgi:2'-5' RNA ligase